MGSQAVATYLWLSPGTLLPRCHRSSLQQYPISTTVRAQTRYIEMLRCARPSPALPAGVIPAPARAKPAYREPSLALMEVTTWVKRRQGDTRAVTPVKPHE